MVPFGIQTKQLAIKGVGNPRQRMPVGRVNRFKCPDDCWPGDAPVDGGIINYVIRIIVVDKFEAGYGPEEGECNSPQQKADKVITCDFRHEQDSYKREGTGDTEFLQKATKITKTIPPL